VGLKNWCDIIDSIDTNKRLKVPSFIEDSNFLDFCNLFEETPNFEWDDRAGMLNKKIALIILGGLVDHHVYRLDKDLGIENKLFIRVKNMCITNYESYLNTVSQYQLINKIVHGAPYFFDN
jgi:hypothetical protein